MRRALVLTVLLAGADVGRHGPPGDGHGSAIDVVAARAVDGRFSRVADGVYVARVRTDELADLARREPTTSALPPMRRTTDLAVPIIGVPQVEAAGLTGRGAWVAVIDSGFDVRHPALRTESGGTRFAWILDYSERLRGVHAEIEKAFGVSDCLARDVDGTAEDGGSCEAADRCPSSTPCAVTRGAVWSGADLDAAVPDPAAKVPTDGEGHGTLAAGIAAGSRLPTTPFRGVASEAALVGVKIDGSGYTLNAGSVIRGVQFVFERAKEAGASAAVNLSLSSDFAVRDGTDPLGPAVASLARGPGRIIIVASGNAGDPILGTHQTVSVAPGEQVHVKLHALNALPYPHAQVIVSPHPGSDLRVGCEAPRGPWVTPVPRGTTRSAQLPDGAATVIFDPKDYDGRLPAASTSALVSMEGDLDLAKDHFYGVVLEGTGTADLWINGAYFEHGVREQTIGSPAMHPELIAVGASVSRSGYRTAAGEDLVLRTQAYDSGGLVPLRGVGLPPAPGAIAAFSGAGPGPMGVVKPDLVAPGVTILSAASTSGDDRNIALRSDQCPSRSDGVPSTDPRCLYVDADHAAATGTSFAAPFVTGAAAVLLQADPTLTQEEMRTALQAGVHRHRSVPRFVESASVGELDVPGALDVARRLRNPIRLDPVRDASWITVSSHYVPADGTRPIEARFHLRAASGEPADGFDVNRFSVAMRTREAVVPPSVVRRLGPGLWTATFDASRHGSGFAVTIEATLDGAPIAPALAVPVALDPWQARYPTTARGATCAATPGEPAEGALSLLATLLLGLALRRRRDQLQPV